MNENLITGGNMGFMDAVLVMRNKVMPGRQIFPFINQLIGASFRQPAHRAHHFEIKIKAIGNKRFSILIIATSAGVGVEQLAGNSSHVNFAVIFILELLQTAQPATIAKTFPFFGCHLVQCFCFIKRSFIHVTIFQPVFPEVDSMINRNWLDGLLNRREIHANL